MFSYIYLDIAIDVFQYLHRYCKMLKNTCFEKHLQMAALLFADF